MEDIEKIIEEMNVDYLRANGIIMIDKTRFIASAKMAIELEHLERTGLLDTKNFNELKEYLKVFRR